MAKASKSSENQSVKKNALLLELDKIEKDYGKGTILGDSSKRKDVISTGSLKLDIATGIGGCARGTVVELMGWESSGKSSIASYLIADAQRQGLGAVLIDGENSFDAGYATTLGVDIDRLTIYQADNGGGEKAYDIAERLIKTKEIGIVVFDSQTVLLPKKMFDDPAEASNLGLHARLLSRVVPKFVAVAGMYNCLVVFISQFREKIGVMYGSPETTNGGNALRFYAHMRFEFRKSILADDEKTAYANKTTVTVKKNKMAPPMKKVTFDIVFGEGIDRVKELFDIAVEMNIIQQAGSWYSYGETKLGQGEDNIIQLLRDNPAYAANLEKKIKQKLEEDARKDNTNRGTDGDTSESIQGDDEGSSRSQIESLLEFNDENNSINKGISTLSHNGTAGDPITQTFTNGEGEGNILLTE